MTVYPTEKVSAVITTYNSAHFVVAAIESVLAQTRAPDEILVIDDGSTDDTAQVVARYAARGVRYLYQENGGPSAARNRGLRESGGELVAFLDADDLWLPEKLERQLAHLAARPELGLVSCDRWVWKVEKGWRYQERFGPRRGADARREVMVRNIVGNPSQVLARRAALLAVGGFDRSMRWAEEWELWTRLAARAPLGFVREPLMIYRWHSTGLAHEKVWERLPGQLAIAFRAIGAFQPAWRRPLLLLRAWSLVEMTRATYAVDFQLPREVQVRHGLRALAYPFEEPREKTRVAVRALMGGDIYQRARARLVPARLRRAGAGQAPTPVGQPQGGRP